MNDIITILATLGINRAKTRLDYLKKYFTENNIRYVIKTYPDEKDINYLINVSCYNDLGISSILNRNVSRNTIEHINDLPLSEAKKYLLNNPKLLKSLLIFNINDSRMVMLAYNKDEVSMFDTANIRNKNKRKYKKEMLSYMMIKQNGLANDIDEDDKEE